MIEQLAVGSLVISLTVIVEATFIGVAIAALTRLSSWLIRSPHEPKTAFAMVGVTLWMMAAHSVGVWIWAVTFLMIGVFDALEPALYFSVVAFTTLGFGDVLLSVDWRLLSGLSAANGLLIFGLSTAFLVEFLTRLRQAQSKVLSISNT